MDNVKLARKFAAAYSKALKPGGMWPHTLNRVSNVDKILRVYKKHFSKVEYNPATDICVCVK